MFLLLLLLWIVLWTLTFLRGRINLLLFIRIDRTFFFIIILLISIVIATRIKQLLPLIHAFSYTFEITIIRWICWWFRSKYIFWHIITVEIIIIRAEICTANGVIEVLIVVIAIIIYEIQDIRRSCYHRTSKWTTWFSFNRAKIIHTLIRLLLRLLLILKLFEMIIDFRSRKWTRKTIKLIYTTSSSSLKQLRLSLVIAIREIRITCEITHLMESS